MGSNAHYAEWRTNDFLDRILFDFDSICWIPSLSFAFVGRRFKNVADVVTVVAVNLL